MVTEQQVRYAVTCAKSHLDVSSDCNFYHEVLDHLLAVYERTLPEAPVYAWCENIEGWCWTCPRCHAQYFEQHSHHCWSCGQALDGKRRDRKVLEQGLRTIATNLGSDG